MVRRVLSERLNQRRDIRDDFNGNTRVFMNDPVVSFSVQKQIVCPVRETTVAVREVCSTKFTSASPDPRNCRYSSPRLSNSRDIVETGNSRSAATAGDCRCRPERHDSAGLCMTLFHDFHKSSYFICLQIGDDRHDLNYFCTFQMVASCDLSLAEPSESPLTLKPL